MRRVLSYVDWLGVLAYLVIAVLVVFWFSSTEVPAPLYLLAGVLMGAYIGRLQPRPDTYASTEPLPPVFIPPSE